MAEARVIALYLPQFHPVKENDEIWGEGFTEWTNVAKAKPLFRGHYQPQIPSALGFYDLRVAEVRNKQAELAKDSGIEGFCYWHYWFGNGKRILDMPFKEVLRSKEPDFPFCLCWANHSWSTSTWNNSKKVKKDVEFLKQQYLGVDDYKTHFFELLPAFKDERYICVDGKPLFAIHSPAAIPQEQLKLFIDTWQELAVSNGLRGMHFVARVETVKKLSDSDVRERIRGGYIKDYDFYLKMGFNAIWADNKRRAEVLTDGFVKRFIRRALYHAFGIRLLDKLDYRRIIQNFRTEDERREDVYPLLIPRWDRTPRQGKLAEIYVNAEPELFKKHLNETISYVKNKQDEHKIIFLQAWNEWGEGNYIEPDLKYGNAFLSVIKECLKGQ